MERAVSAGIQVIVRPSSRIAMARTGSVHLIRIELPKEGPSMSITDERRLNGVDTPALFATIDAVRRQPELARFQFRTANRWVSGTHSQGTFPGFYGAGVEHVHVHDTVQHADHPAVLVGEDRGPTPAELLLNALGACLMAGLGNIAAARGIKLNAVRCSVEGDIDLRGI